VAATVGEKLVRGLRSWTTRVGRWLPEEGDAVLYGLSALFAALTAGFSGITLYAQWGQLAVGPYAAATVVLALAARHRRRAGARAAPDDPEPADPEPAVPGPSGPVPADAVRSQPVPAHPAVADPGPGRTAGWSRLRIGVFIAVLLGATLIPLGLEVTWRHAQPEVSVVQQAAGHLAHGTNPYQLPVRAGHVVPDVPGQPAYESFFPYLPLMTVFGLPSSTHQPVRLTDARIFFSLVTLLVAGGALALCRAPTERRVRALMVLTVLPTAALPLATGGDDMPVVALLLLAMVLAQRRRPGLSGLVLGVVSAMKFTAWPLALLALFAARDRSGRRAPGRMALGMLVVAVPVVVPFLTRNPHDFVENVVLFPLGLAGVASPAASPMPGHLLVSAFPHLHRILPLTVAAIGGVVLVRHLVRRPPASAGAVCTLAGWVMTVAIAFAPATRVGYLLYPINFFIWGYLLKGADELAAPVPADAVVAAAPS
jgi:hypothetical protein